jgi:hypothetical protein
MVGDAVVGVVKVPKESLKKPRNVSTTDVGKYTSIVNSSIERIHRGLCRSGQQKT